MKKYSKSIVFWLFIFVLAALLGLLGIGLIVVEKNFWGGMVLLLISLSMIWIIQRQSCKILKISSVLLVFAFLFIAIALISSGCFKMS